MRNIRNRVKNMNMKNLKVKKLFRRNQIIITTLAVMIAAAGYLNYAGKGQMAAGDGAYEAGMMEISDEDILAENQAAADTSGMEEIASLDNDPSDEAQTVEEATMAAADGEDHIQAEGPADPGVDNPGEAVLTREALAAHITASGFVMSPDLQWVLMAWQNIYRSWSWTGGHADGDPDLLGVALREAAEETSATGLRPLSPSPLSVEVLPVPAHRKNGREVSPHLHLNFSFLLLAPREGQVLREKPDENSGVRWFSLDGAVAASVEPWMQRRVYEKLNAKLRAGWER